MSEYSNLIIHYEGGVRGGRDLKRKPGQVTKIKLSSMSMDFIENKLIYEIRDVDSIEFVKDFTAEGAKFLALCKVISQTRIREIEMTDFEFRLDSVISIDEFPNLDSIKCITIDLLTSSTEGFVSFMNMVEKCQNIRFFTLSRVQLDSIEFRRLKEMLEVCKDLEEIHLGSIWSPFSTAIDTRNMASNLYRIYRAAVDRGDRGTIYLADDAKEWPTEDQERTVLHELIEVLCNKGDIILYTDRGFNILPLCNDYTSSIDMGDNPRAGNFNNLIFYYNFKHIVFGNGPSG